MLIYVELMDGLKYVIHRCDHILSRFIPVLYIIVSRGLCLENSRFTFIFILGNISFVKPKRFQESSYINYFFTLLHDYRFSELIVAFLFDPDKIIIVDKGMIMRYSLLRDAGICERRNDYVLFFTSGYRNMQRSEERRVGNGWMWRR